MIRPISAKRSKALSKISIAPLCASPQPLSTIDADRRLRVHRKTYALKAAWHCVTLFRVRGSDKVLVSAPAMSNVGSEMLRENAGLRKREGQSAIVFVFEAKL